MKIYTGETGDPKKVKQLEKYDLGIMLSSSPNHRPSYKSYRKFSCALDNGAFACYRKGYPFQEDIFLWVLKRAYKGGLVLDFIVCPDIVCGGLTSLEFSRVWAKRLVGTPNLALAVHDGMKFKDLKARLGSQFSSFSYIFIGGSKEWKWKTAKDWVSFAHDYGKKCHIGQCGTIDKMICAKEIGADSIDSTSIVRDNKISILEEL